MRGKMEEPLVVATVSRKQTWSSRSRKGHARWFYVLPVALFQTISMTLTIAILPRIKLNFFSDDSRMVTRVQSSSEAIRAVFVFLVSSKIGSLSDLIGRRPLMFLGSVSTLAPLLCLIYSDNLWLYFVVFCLGGLLGGDNTSALMAYIADTSKEVDRARHFGFAGASFAIVFALGPLFGSVLEMHTNAHVVFTVAAFAAVIAGVVISAVPESLPADRLHRPEIKSAMNLLQPVNEFLREADARMWLLVATSFSRSCVMEAYMTVTFFAFKELVPAWDDEDNGLLLFMVGAGGVIAKGLLLPCLLKLGWNDTNLALFSQGATTLGSALQVAFLCAFPSKTCIFAAVALCNSFNFFDPVFTKMVTSGREGNLGLVLGVIQSLGEFTAVFAPILFTATFAFGAMWTFVLVVVFNAIALVCVIIVVSTEAYKISTVGEKAFAEIGECP